MHPSPGSWCNLTDLMWWSVSNLRWNSSRRPWISANCWYVAGIWSLFSIIFKFKCQSRLDTTTFTILKEVAPCDPTVVMAEGDGTIWATVTEVFVHWRKKCLIARNYRLLTLFFRYLKMSYSHYIFLLNRTIFHS